MSRAIGLDNQSLIALFGEYKMKTLTPKELSKLALLAQKGDDVKVDTEALQLSPDAKRIANAIVSPSSEDESSDIRGAADAIRDWAKSIRRTQNLIAKCA